MRRYLLQLSFLMVGILSFFPLNTHATGIVRVPNNLGLVGYWSFDEGAGTQVSDLSGNGNDGILAGGASWDIGKKGSAALVSGSPRFVDLSNGGCKLSRGIRDDDTEFLVLDKQ